MIEALHHEEIQVYADVVLNHRVGADHCEHLRIVLVDINNRKREIEPPREIEAWVAFNFFARKGKYSNFTWHWYHFTGEDYDQLRDEQSIFRILGEGKDWADNDVDNELENYGSVMFADIDYSHPEVIDEAKNWVKCFIRETGVDGFRLDAAKHIDHDFIEKLISFVREEYGNDFFFVAVYWDGEYDDMIDFIDSQNYHSKVFDTLLHFKFADSSKGAASLNIRGLNDRIIKAKKIQV